MSFLSEPKSYLAMNYETTVLNELLLFRYSKSAVPFDRIFFNSVMFKVCKRILFFIW